MADSSLQLAQQRRQCRADELLLEQAEFVLARVGLSEERCLKLAASPEDRKKLKGILAHYAKMAHPFTACVNDNTKRFGKGRAERICAKLKDMIRGTTKWRKGSAKMHASEDLVILECPILDVGIAQLIELADSIALAELLSEGDS